MGIGMVASLLKGILVLLVLILTITVSMFSLVWFLLGGGRIRWFSAWREVAPRYRAIVDSKWWKPRMRFSWRGELAVLQSVRHMDGTSIPGTFLESVAPELNDRLSVYSRNWPGFSGTADLRQSGFPVKSGFDSRFEIRGGNSSALSEHVRWQISELAEWSGKNCLQIELAPRRIRIWISSKLKTAGELDDFLRLGLRIADQLRTAKTDGLDFVNENQATILNDVFCPICTALMEGKMVICIRCKTPHCRDCWEYNGKCGMFACTETRYAPVGLR